MMPNNRIPSPESPLAHRDALFCDLDGVVYAGSAPIADAIVSLEAVRALMPVGYLTNNASRTPDQIAAQLAQLGLGAKPRDIVTSPQAAMRILADRLHPGDRVLLVGGEGLRAEIENAGYLAVTSADDQPRAVVQGFSPTLGWAQLAEAAFALRGTDVFWLATNMDWTIPLDRGIAPGNGTLVSAVHTAVGRLPDAVAGKPERALFDAARERMGARAPLMVGDRLDTDIAGARRAEMASALVLTGIDRARALFAATVDERPDYILGSLSELFETYPMPVVEGNAGRFSCHCAGEIVELDGNLVRVRSAASNQTAVIRAACSAIWGSGQSIYQLELDRVLLDIASREN